jgi:hypothetical protein
MLPQSFVPAGLASRGWFYALTGCTVELPGYKMPFMVICPAIAAGLSISG